MNRPIEIVLPLVATNITRYLLCLLAIIAAGCGCSGTNPTDARPASIAATVDKNDSGLVLSISKGKAIVYRQVISDAPVSEAQVEERSLDFNGDGKREFVVYLWEGQNSGDRILVFGERDGKWAQWMNAYRPGFKSEFVKVGDRDRIRVFDPDAMQIKTLSFEGEGLDP